MIKRLWYFFGFMSVVVLLVLSMLQTTWFSTYMLRRVMAERAGVVVKAVSVGGQHFYLPGRFHFQSVRVALLLHGRELVALAPEVDVSGLQQWFGPDRRFLLDVPQARLQYDKGDIKDLRAQFTVTAQGLSGPVSAAACQWDKWQVTDADAFMIVTASGVELRALKFKAYDGVLTGKVMVGAATVPVSYAGEIFVEGLNVIKLGEVNPAIADQLDGVTSGTVSFKGDVDSLQGMDASLAMPKGGNVSAALLAALTQYLPASSEKKRLDRLIRQGGKLGMELFSFTLKGGDQGRFAGELHLRSRAINLELNLTHEINTDGTIASMLANWQKFVQ